MASTVSFGSTNGKRKTYDGYNLKGVCKYQSLPSVCGQTSTVVFISNLVFLGAIFNYFFSYLS